jgi:hypothetical protein
MSGEGVCEAVCQDTYTQVTKDLEEARRLHELQLVAWMDHVNALQQKIIKLQRRVQQLDCQLKSCVDSSI